MTAIVQVQNAWRVAAKELNFDFVAPFAIEDAGDRVSFHGFVRDFGGPHGTVFLACETFGEDFGRALELAKEKGYFCSRISAEVYGSFDREIFLEVLRDWGWFGHDANRPEWCAVK
ncbi:MAG: hypothetical protein ABIZ04_04120 [Opitutus sp.]